MSPPRENVPYFPGGLRAMLRHHLYPVHRVRAESCAQALDQLRHAGRAPPGARKEIAGLRPATTRGPLRSRSARTGPGNSSACKPLAQQLGDPSGLRRGLRKAQAHACRWHIAVQQREVEHVHPATPELEERAQFIHQRPGSPAKAFRVGDLGLEVAPRRVAFPRHEGDTRIGRATRRHDRAHAASAARTGGRIRRAAASGNRRWCARPSQRVARGTSPASAHRREAAARGGLRVHPCCARRLPRPCARTRAKPAALA